MQLTQKISEYSDFSVRWKLKYCLHLYKYKHIANQAVQHFILECYYIIVFA